MSEERFDPRRHNLDYAAMRLEKLSEENEMATGGLIEDGTWAYVSQSSPEIVHMPKKPVAQPIGRHNANNLPWRYAWNLTGPVAPSAEPLTEERIREIVAEAIRKVLYPDQDGIVTHEHRRVRQWDETGTEWRGVLYRVEKESEM
jgi:hypothetical protein